MLANTKMVKDLCDQIHKGTCPETQRVTLPKVLDGIKSTDANFEIVKSASLQHIQLTRINMVVHKLIFLEFSTTKYESHKQDKQRRVWKSLLRGENGSDSDNNNAHDAVFNFGDWNDPDEEEEEVVNMPQAPIWLEKKAGDEVFCYEKKNTQGHQLKQMINKIREKNKNSDVEITIEECVNYTK